MGGDDKESPEQKPRETKTGIIKAVADKAEDRADEALDQERGARDELVTILREEIAQLRADRDAAIARLTVDKDKLGAQLKWLIRAFVGENLLILIMFGVAVNVVKGAEISVPGYGTVNLGETDTPVAEAAARPSAIVDTAIKSPESLTEEPEVQP